MTHLLDPMQVFKNVLDSLSKHIYLTKKDKNASNRYLIMSKTKKHLQEEVTTNMDG